MLALTLCTNSCQDSFLSCGPNVADVSYHPAHRQVSGCSARMSWIRLLDPRTCFVRQGCHACPTHQVLRASVTGICQQVAVCSMRAWGAVCRSPAGVTSAGQRQSPAAARQDRILGQLAPSRRAEDADDHTLECPVSELRDSITDKRAVVLASH